MIRHRRTATDLRPKNEHRHAFLCCNLQHVLPAEWLSPSLLHQGPSQSLTAQPGVNPVRCCWRSVLSVHQSKTKNATTGRVHQELVTACRLRTLRWRLTAGTAQQASSCESRFTQQGPLVWLYSQNLNAEPQFDTTVANFNIETVGCSQLRMHLRGNAS